MPISQAEFDELTLVKLAIRFKERKGSLIEWLQSNRMLSPFKFCESCNTEMSLGICSRAIDGVTWRCQIKECRKKTNIRKGSFFERSHLELWQILALTYLWSSSCGSSRGPSYEWIMKELEIGGEHSIVDWFQFCRDICYSFFVRFPQQIGGQGIIVEIDESLFARRKNNVGRVVPQQWVFGGFDTVTKIGFLVEVPDRSAATLIPIIQQWIRPGSIIYSDCWLAYSQLNSLGYTHQTVNHKRNFVDPKTGACTNQVEGMWSRAKSKFKSLHGTNRSLISEYLAEFMWSQRFSEHSFFNFWNQICTNFYPLSAMENDSNPDDSVPGDN